MLEKIKALISTIKQGIIWIIAPITIIMGYIFYLMTKISKLQSQLAVSKAEKQVAEVLTKKEEAKNEANTSELDYDVARDKYLRDNGITLTDPGTGDKSGT